MVGKLGNSEQTQSHSHAVLQSHPPATHRDSQLSCRSPGAASSKATQSCHMGLTKSPSGPASSLVELNRNMYFLAIHLSQCGCAGSCSLPRCKKGFFSALFLVIFGSYFAFFAAPEHWVALFYGASCEELIILHGQSPSVGMQHVGLFTPTCTSLSGHFSICQCMTQSHSLSSPAAGHCPCWPA